MYKKLALTCLLVLMSAGVIAKSGYYRWLDDNGQAHFTQKPPLDRPSKFIETARGYSSDEASPESSQSEPPKNAASSPGKNEPKQIEILPDKDPERCAQAKAALQSLDRGQRVRVTDDKGETRILNADEKKAQKDQAQEAIDVYC